MCQDKTDVETDQVEVDGVENGNGNGRYFCYVCQTAGLPAEELWMLNRRAVESVLSRKERYPLVTEEVEGTLQGFLDRLRKQKVLLTCKTCRDDLQKLVGCPFALTVNWAEQRIRWAKSKATKYLQFLRQGTDERFEAHLEFIRRGVEEGRFTLEALGTKEDELEELRVTCSEFAAQKRAQKEAEEEARREERGREAQAFKEQARADRAAERARLEKKFQRFNRGSWRGSLGAAARAAASS